MTDKKSLGIRELAELAKATGALDLAQGIIDAPPPEILVKNLRSIPIEKYSAYNNKRGVPTYREAIRDYLASRHWQITVDQVIGTAGATGGISSALLTACRPGDAVLLPEPFFVYHKLLLEVLGFKISFFPVPLDRQPDWKHIAEKMRDVKAVIITTPANPTGQVAPPEVLQKLTQSAAENGCLLLLDEMYREFIWDETTPDDSIYKELNLDKTVILRSFSKTLATPGWRVGFAVTSPERVQHIAIRHDALYIGGSTIAQHALAVTLKNDLPEINAYVVNLRNLLKKNMVLLAEASRAYGMHPLPVPATYYMLMKHNRASDLAALEELMEKKVFVTPANILYSDPTKDTGFIRIHFAVSPETVKEVRRRLAKVA